MEKQELNVNKIIESFINVYHKDDIAKANKLESENNELHKAEIHNIRIALQKEHDRLLLQFRTSWNPYFLEIKKSTIENYTNSVLSNLKREARPALIDWVQPDIERNIWDNDNKLKETHKKQIYDTLYKALDDAGYKNYKEWIEGGRIMGSLTSYQYNTQSDLDCHFIVNLNKAIDSEDNLKKSNDNAQAILELDKVIKQINDKIKPILSNTIHPLEYYFEIYTVDNKGNKDWITKGEPQVDHGEYSLDDDKWVKEAPPIKYTFDIEQMFPGMITGVMKILADMDIIIGEIKRDILSAKRLQETIDRWYKVSKDKVVYFEERLNEKCNEITEDAKKFIAQCKEFKKLKDDERKLKTQYGFGEITFKYLTKYHYYHTAAKFEDILKSEGGTIPVSRIDEIEKILLNPKERR